ncbi:Multidrug resistance-associated protein 7, variant 4 [Lathyrus oleraceus]|uniref:Multidrug resistance-associated protein 7, variant 4 n=1 Tax=Pisum sativum TaxID=3888 RepID=A0A9D4Y0U1_PEA|nr:Multidrug resistance-associated protein 7, variant 4 [Pisum sativum]
MLPSVGIILPSECIVECSLETCKVYALIYFLHSTIIIHNVIWFQLSAAWGIGLVIGPALGGYLAQPAVKYPHLFPKDSFWDKFPYFLPSLSVSAFAFVVAIACIWLPETLHNHPLSNESIDDAEALETGNISNDDDKIIQKDENLFLNWPLMSSIIVYSIFSLYNVAYQEGKIFNSATSFCNSKWCPWVGALVLWHLDFRREVDEKPNGIAS